MKPLRAALVIFLSLTYSWLWLIQPIIAQPQFNIITNGNFSQGLTGWRIGSPFCQGSYDIGVVSERLRISLMNDTNARAAIGQAWQFNSTGYPIESTYTVKDNNHLSLDIFLDIIAREHSTKYITSLDVVLTGTPNTTITYAFNGTQGLGNPLNTVFSNSSLTGRFCFIIQMENQTWYSLDRNVVTDLAAVAPALDPASTKYIAVVFKSYFLPTSAAPLPHGDYLRTWFDNIVLGGAYSVKVYDVACATVTLDGASQTVAGTFIQFVNVPYGVHSLSTTPTVTAGTERYLFLNWVISGSLGYWLGQPLSLSTTKDTVVTVGRKGQYRVTIQSAPITNVNIYVDGASTPTAQTNCDLWFDNDTSHSLKAEPEISGFAGYTFDKWVGGSVNTPLNPVTILVNTSYTLTAAYVPLAATFRISISPTTRTINQGNSTTFTIEVRSISGFADPVTLSATSSPAGLTLAVTPINATPTFTGTLSVATTSLTDIGDYFISVTGTSGTIQQGAAVILRVSGRDFSISISPGSQTTYVSLTATFTVSVQPIGGFSDSVSLTLSGGLPASLSISSGISPFTSVLTVLTTNSTTIGTYTFTVTGTGWGRTHSASASLSVLEYPPDYVVTVKSVGLPSSSYAAKIYVDKIESEYSVYDGYPATFSFKALTSHNVTVDFLVSSTNTRYRCTSNQATVSDTTTLTFTFSPEYLVVFKPKLPSDQTVTVTVDGVAYVDETPFTVELWLAKDASVTFSIAPTKLLNVDGKNYSFLEWRDQTGKVVKSPVKVKGPLTLTAQYIISELTLTVYDTPGATITLGSVSKTVAEGQTYVVFDVNNGTYALSTTEYIIVTEGKTRIAFVNWRIPKGTGTEFRTVSVNVTITGESVVAEVKRVRQHHLSVASLYGSLRGTGWFEANTTVTFSVTSPVDQGNNTRRVFVHWVGDYTGTSPTGSLFLDGPKTISAEWKVQYKLTITSRYGTTSGEGWYDLGTTATFSVTPPTEDGTTYIFAGWTGDYTGTERIGRVEMNQPKSITASWRRQYLVSIIFTDPKDIVLKERPSRVIFTSPNASSITFASYTNLWLDEGTWTLKSVIFHGVDVKQKELSYNPKPRDTWRIQLKLVSLIVKVASSLTGAPLGNAPVTITLPDGTSITNQTDPNGLVTFAQLPPGTYTVLVEKEGSSSQRSISLTGDLQENFSVLPTSDIITYIILPIVGLVSLVIASIIFMKRRRRASRTLEPPSTPLPSPLSEPSTTEPPVEDSLSKWLDDKLREEPS